MTEKPILNFIKNTLDVIEDIVAIGIAVGILLFGWFVDESIFENATLLWSGVVTILTIMAIGNLRDRSRRLRKIHETVNETFREIKGSKIIEESGADNFFNRSEDEIKNSLMTATEIDMVGITFATTRGNIQELIKDRLKVSAKIRIIMLDNTSDDSLEQLVRRSWSKKANKGDYISMIGYTTDLLEEVINEPGLSGSFEIGYLPFIPSIGMTLVDMGQDTGVGVVSLYHQLKKPSQTFSFSKHNDPETCRFYIDQFNLMWAECNKHKLK